MQRLPVPRRYRLIQRYPQSIQLCHVDFLRVGEVRDLQRCRHRLEHGSPYRSEWYGCRLTGRRCGSCRRRCRCSRSALDMGQDVLPQHSPVLPSSSYVRQIDPGLSRYPPDRRRSQNLSLPARLDRCLGDGRRSRWLWFSGRRSSSRWRCRVFWRWCWRVVVKFDIAQRLSDSDDVALFRV